MKKLLSFILLLILFACQEEEKGGLLWEISGNGLKKPSYLFGTWHGDTELRNASFLDSVPGFHKAFESVEQFIWEGGYMPENFQQMIMMPTDTCYADLLDEEEIQFLDSTLMAKLGAEPSKIKMLRPTHLALIIGQIETIKKIDESIKKRVKKLEETNVNEPDSLFYKKRNALYSERDVMDIQLAKRAGSSHLSILALDSIIKFDLFDPIKKIAKTTTLKEEAKDLIKGFKMNTDSLEEAIMPSLLAFRMAYRSQDMKEVGKYKNQQLDAVVNKEYTREDIDKLMKIILEDRNHNWMNHIPTLLANKSSFIAVGAVHLPYEDGLIKLLRKEGYTVKPVTN